MLRLDAPIKAHWEITPTGNVKVFAAIGEADRNLKYLESDANGKVKERIEYIAEDQLFKQESIETAYGLPVVLTHPSSGLFENNKEGLLVGSTLQQFTRDDKTLLIPLVLQDKRAVNMVREALDRQEQLEVSPAYWLQSSLLMLDGRYQQIMRFYDHLAAPLKSGEGRGGSAIRLRFDSSACISPLLVDPNESTGRIFPGERDQGTIQYGKDQNKITIIDFGEIKTKTIKTDRKPQMKTIVINSVGYEIEDEDLFNATVELKQRADSQLTELATTKTEKESLQAQVDTLMRQNADLKGELSGYKVKLDSWEKTGGGNDALATDRKDSIETWLLILPQLRQDNKDYEPDFKLSPTEIKAMFLCHKYPDLKTDMVDIDLNTGAGKTYINSLWKVLQPHNSTSGNRQDSFNKSERQFNLLGNPELHNDANKNKESARSRAQKKIEENWKGSA